MSAPAAPLPADGGGGLRDGLVTATTASAPRQHREIKAHPRGLAGTWGSACLCPPPPRAPVGKSQTIPRQGQNQPLRLPSDGEQRHDQHCRGEAVHALLHHDAIDGQPRVVGQEGLSCRTNTGHGVSAPLRGIGTGAVLPSAIAGGQHHAHHKGTWSLHEMPQEVQPVVARGDVSFPCVFYHLFTWPTQDTPPSTPKKAILGCCQAPHHGPFPPCEDGSTL